jgi:hypothetical protein
MTRHGDYGLWSTHDQSGNARDVTLRNAALEGVGDRVNVQSGAARAEAIGEAWRVLKAGGRLAIADIRVTGRYAETLRGLGGPASHAAGSGGGSGTAIHLPARVW